MSLSPEFFKALWMEAHVNAFVEEQGGCGPIFCMHAENPVRARRLSLAATLANFGPEYWRLMPIEEEQPG